MNINITSTTDSDDAVTAALGGLAKKTDEVKEEKKSVSDQRNDQDEKNEQSGSSKEDLDDQSEDDSDELDESEKDDEVKDDKPKKKGGFKKRIERFQKQISAKEQELAYWKEQALKGGQSKTDDQIKSTQKAETPAEGKPKKEDFENLEDYLEAVTDWKVEQKEKAREVKKSEDETRSSYQKQVSSFQDKVSEFKKTADDFDEVINDVDHIPLSMGTQAVILNSEIGPRLLYEIAKDEALYEKINKMHPIDAARELGKIEAKLSSSESETKKEAKVTKAPAPIKTLSSNAKAQKSPDDMDFQEFKKWRALNK